MKHAQPNKNKRQYQSTDDKFALFIYFLIVIYLLCCELQRSILWSSELMYSYVYLVTLIFASLFTLVLIVSKIFNCYKAELLCLSFFNVSSAMLLLEKSLLFFMLYEKFDFVTYFIYIFSSVFQLVFAVYRMFKVKETLRVKTEASKIFKNHDEYKIKAERGDV